MNTLFEKVLFLRLSFNFLYQISKCQGCCDSNMRIFFTRSGFKTSDQVQGQGVPRIESGAYTLVREHFNLRDNAAIGPEMGL
jgi:hypothetical protein